LVGEQEWVSIIVERGPERLGWYGAIIYMLYGVSFGRVIAQLIVVVGVLKGYSIYESGFPRAWRWVSPPSAFVPR
jgi:hypothetical protein